MPLKKEGTFFPDAEASGPMRGQGGVRVGMQESLRHKSRSRFFCTGRLCGPVAPTPSSESQRSQGHPESAAHQHSRW